MPIGLEDSHSGVVDVVCGRAFQFSGVKGENVEEIAVPESMKVRNLMLRIFSLQLIATEIAMCRVRLRNFVVVKGATDCNRLRNA